MTLVHSEVDIYSVKIKIYNSYFGAFILLQSTQVTV